MATATQSVQSTKAFVRCQAEEPNLVVALTVAGRQRNLNRPKDEPLEKALARLRASVAPAPRADKKNKRKAPPDASRGDEAPVPAAAPAAPELLVCLYEDEAGSRPIPLSATNQEAWTSARLLQIGSESFLIECNAPTVEKLTLPKRPMSGFPLLPTFKLLFADPGASTWRWRRKAAGSSEWQDTGCTDVVYRPTAADVGCMLQAECTPAAPRADGSSSDSGGGGSSAAGADVEMRDAGAATAALKLGEAATAETGPVVAGPARTSASVRCPHGPAEPAPAPAFRILSYNLLADQYAGSTYAQKVLFNYCPEAALDPDYRKQLILLELEAYNADVMCLQEVDERLFTEYLQPYLALQGYAGHFTNKQGKVREGSATFWRTSRYRRVCSKDILMRDVFKQPLAPAHQQWQGMLGASPDLVHALQKVTTIAQATVLVPVAPQGSGEASGRSLCVVNTHLFYHPFAPHIRTMHVAAILEEVAELLRQTAGSAGSTAGGGDPAAVTAAAAAPRGAEQSAQGEQQQGLPERPAVVFCGDLNSDLNDGIPGVIELLQSGKLAASHWDWIMGAAFKWGMGGEEDGGEASQPAGATAATATTTAATTAPNGSSRSAIEAAVAAAKAASTAATAAPAPASSAVQQQQAVALSGAVTADDGHAFEAAAVPDHGIAVTGIDVAVPIAPLRSADDLKTPFTNYTSGYKALLDYCWYEPAAFEVVASVPVPSEQEIGSFIPSPSFPSDHLAVVYDLRPR